MAQWVTWDFWASPPQTLIFRVLLWPPQGHSRPLAPIRLEGSCEADRPQLCPRNAHILWTLLSPWSRMSLDHLSEGLEGLVRWDLYLCLLYL